VAQAHDVPDTAPEMTETQAKVVVLPLLIQGQSVAELRSFFDIVEPVTVRCFTEKFSKDDVEEVSRVGDSTRRWLKGHPRASAASIAERLQTWNAQVQTLQATASTILVDD